MATTFVDVADSCENSSEGSEQCFANNSDVQLWAITVQSWNGGVPEAVVIAEGIAEGTFGATSSGAVCNNPGNSDRATYTGCAGLTYKTADTTCTVSGASVFYKLGSGVAAAEAQGQVIASSSNYCDIATDANKTTLTTGGQSLKTWAEDQEWTVVPTGWYNAAYAWGASPWDGSGHYRSSNYEYAPSSDIDGSALIYFIESNGLYNLA